MEAFGEWRCGRDKKEKRKEENHITIFNFKRYALYIEILL